LGGYHNLRDDHYFNKLVYKRNNFRNFCIRWNRLPQAEKEAYAWQEMTLIDEHKEQLLQQLLALDMRGILAFCKKFHVTPDKWLLRLSVSLESIYAVTRLSVLNKVLNLFPVLVNYTGPRLLYEYAVKRNAHIVLVDMCLAMAPLCLPPDILCWISEHVVPYISLFQRRAIICRICDPHLQRTNQTALGQKN
jgi:hypothetical protein